MTEPGVSSEKGNGDSSVINVRADQTPAKVIPYTSEAGDQYAIGDCYERGGMPQEWEFRPSEPMPYLDHIKSLSTSWRQLRHLADWMEVGTDPQRWTDEKFKPELRKERAKKTNVTLIDCSSQEKPRNFTNISALKATLQSSSNGSLGSPTFRLIIVEDLSQQVIELLGSKYDIDPLFFREQIGDYNWFNTRDSWAIAPTLMAGMKHRTWFRLRHIRFRYMPDKKTFKEAQDESSTFNVFRRPDDDGNHWPYRDKPGSIIAMTRTKTSIWIGRDPENEHQNVGIVLVDPTTTKGYPLWFGHGNWQMPPSMHGKSTPRNPASPSTLYNHILQASSCYPWFSSLEEVPMDKRIFAFPTLYTICAEWLVVYEYLKARLSQIEWELEKPKVFRPNNDPIDSALKRLHVWRRVLPVLREMLDETVEHAFPAISRLTRPLPIQDDTHEEILADFKRVRNSLDELQRRIDRLTEVVAAEISTEDSRRGLKENSNLARLTGLATTFVPLSFLASFFSMTGDVTELRMTYLWYFVVAIPLTTLTLVVARGVGRGWFEKRKWWKSGSK